MTHPRSAFGAGRPLQLAIVYPGDAEVRRAATLHNNRFAPLFAAFAQQGVQAHPAVYHDDTAAEVQAQLLGLDGALVWVNPIEAGRSRSRLDQMLRAVAAQGVFVSAHPDVILKLGTKDVLVDTRHLGWGSDCHRVDSLAQLHQELPARLAAGLPRVLKQHRGHSGIGVWKVEREPAPSSLLRVRHAQRGSGEERVTLDDFAARCAPYFDDGGHMVDQAWQPRLAEGMVRCYLVGDRVAGFGHQAVNALFPAPPGAPPGHARQPGPRLYHGPDVPAWQSLKQWLEDHWLPAALTALQLKREQLPLLWDCDFMLGPRDADGQDSHVLCEINVSSVAPFPDAAIAPLVQATVQRLRLARQHRTGAC